MKKCNVRLFGQTVIVAMSVAVGISAQAAIILTGSPYSQNFNSLSSTSWTNDSTLQGWSLFKQPAPGTGLTTIAIDDGGSNAGSFYSYGPTGNSDRALGGVGSGGAYFSPPAPASGAVAGWIAASFTNDTNSTVDSFTVEYDGEQWRNGGNTSAQTIVMEYGFGSSFTGVPSWTAAGAGFNFISPVVGASAAALNGNVAPNRADNRGGTVSGLSWADGSTLWLRWIERNDSGNDHGLAIDDFSISTTQLVQNLAPIVTPDGGSRGTLPNQMFMHQFQFTDDNDSALDWSVVSFTGPTAPANFAIDATGKFTWDTTGVPGGSDQVYSLVVRGTDHGPGTPLFNDGSITIVLPEPATCSLLVLGLAGIMCRRRF